MPARTAAVAAAAALLALGASACGDDTSPAASSATAPGPSAAASTPGAVSTPAAGQPTNPPPTTASGPPAQAPTGGQPAQSPNAKSASNRCTVTELRMRLGTGDPGAGNIYYPLRFTNTGSRTCVLDGFPGVSLIRGDGSTIGRPADREGTKAAAIRLAPGKTVEADLHTLNQGIKGGGCWRKPTFLKAYPPGSTDAMTLATSSPLVCGDTFDVGPVH